MTNLLHDPLTGEWRTRPGEAVRRPAPPPHCLLCPTRDPARPTLVPWPAFDVVALADPVSTRRTVVFSDDHGARLASVPVERVHLLVDVWAQQYAEVVRADETAYVHIAEPPPERVPPWLWHPHTIVEPFAEVPPLPARELSVARRHLERDGTCILCEIVGRERGDGVRMVAQNQAFVAFVPTAARHPYELHVVAQRHAASLLDLSDPERQALAMITSQATRIYEQLLGGASAHVLTLHQAPTDAGVWQPVSHLHLELIPAAAALSGELAVGVFDNAVPPEHAAAQMRSYRQDD